jgi:lanosterol synthase
MVYLPMGYIYAKRLNPEPTDFILQLRDELYVQPYNEINWNAQRNNVAEADLFLPHTKIMDVINGTFPLRA